MIYSTQVHYDILSGVQQKKNNLKFHLTGLTNLDAFYCDCAFVFSYQGISTKSLQAQTEKWIIINR